MDKISVIICVHNPKQDIFNKVLKSLQTQTLSQKEWELIVIDNQSIINIDSWLNLSWHQEAKIIREEKLGLIHARIRGTLEAKYEILVSVDDDTPLYNDYLENVQKIYLKNSSLGIIGGRTIPVFEIEPPTWLKEFHGCLAIRDLGENEIIEQLGAGEKLATYPKSAPLLIAPKKDVMLKYISYFNSNEGSKELGRKGDSLASGEDNDINLFTYSKGYALGYFPQLKFYHIIPAKRIDKDYLSRLLRSMNKTWVKVLEQYEINPWSKIPKWSLPIRKVKSYLSNKAWKDEASFIKWQGACGLFEGLASIK